MFQAMTFLDFRQKLFKLNESNGIFRKCDTIVTTTCKAMKSQTLTEKYVGEFREFLWKSNEAQ